MFNSQANARNTEWQLVSDLLTVKGSLKNNDIELEFFNKLNPVVNFILKGHTEFADVVSCHSVLPKFLSIFEKMSNRKGTCRFNL